MAKKCLNCGFFNDDADLFCKRCHSFLKGDNYEHHEYLPEDINWFNNKLFEGKVNLPVKSCSIILKKDEKPIIAIPNVELSEPRSVRTSSGTYGGPTFRVAKGVSFRLGGGNSRSVSHEEIQKVDEGILTITNKRLVFSGRMKTLNYNLNKIISVTPYLNGIGVQRDNKQKMEYFLGTDEIDINFKKDGEIHKTPFYGMLLNSVIMGQIQRLE